MASIALRSSIPAPEGKRARQVETRAQRPAPGWKAIAIGTWKEGSKDNISIVAAGVAFYGLLAMVPLLGATVLIYGLVASPEAVLNNVQSLATSLPKDVAKLIGDQLLSVVKTSGGKKGVGLLIAIAIALWGARNAAGSMLTALNIAYEKEEERSFVKLTFLSLVITVAGAALGISGAIAVGLMAQLQAWLPNLGTVGVIAGKVLAYVILAAAAAAAAATLYRYGPSRAKTEWTWITPGSMFFAAGWVFLTLGFGFYVAHFGKYNVTYGSLGGVIVFITWLYLSAFILLYGAEFNSEIERLTANDNVQNRWENVVENCDAGAADHVARDLADGATAGTKGWEKSSLDHARQARSLEADYSRQRAQHEHPFLVARATSRTLSIVGMQKVGMISAALSTLGLALLRKRGREGAGIALLAGAVGLSLLKREH